MSILNKYRIILLGFLLAFSVLSVNSQSMNNIAVWGSAGYNTFFTSSTNISTKGNLGYLGGVGYELHYKRFMMQVGAEFGYYNARLVYDDFLYDRKMTDTEGDDYDGHFYFMNGNNVDKYSYGNVNIPLMFGLQSGIFYGMVGGKVGLNVMGKSVVSSTLKSTSTYARFIEDFENMANHDLLTRDLQKYEYPIDFNLNVSVAAEFGAYLGASYKSDGGPKFRLAVYADYGLLDIHNKSGREDLVLNKRGEPYFYPGLNSFMLANPVVDKPVNPFYVGLKFTVIFQIQDKRDCMCEKYLGGKGLLWGIPWGD